MTDLSEIRDAVAKWRVERPMSIHTGSIGRFAAEVDALVSTHRTTPQDATELKFLGIRVVEDDQVLPHIAVLKHGDEVVAVVNFDA